MHKLILIINNKESGLVLTVLGPWDPPISEKSIYKGLRSREYTDNLFLAKPDNSVPGQFGAVMSAYKQSLIRTLQSL